MEKTLELSSNNFSEEIGDSGLEKEHRNFLREIVSCYLRFDTPPCISESSFENFRSKVPGLKLDGKKVNLKIVETDCPRITLAKDQSDIPPIPISRKKSSRMLLTRKKKKGSFGA